MIGSANAWKKQAIGAGPGIQRTARNRLLNQLSFFYEAGQKDVAAGELVVATAVAPRLSNSRALAASHAFGNRSGIVLLWSIRKASAM